jgi:hypothetical protein
VPDLAARAEPDGLYARMEAELGVQQMDFVQRDQTDQAFHPSQSTVRHWTNQGGTAYGAAVAIGGALKPGLVLAHVRIVQRASGKS